MDRVRRLFSNLQCCKSGTEAGDSLKERNEKYLMHVVDCADDEYEMKALHPSKAVAEETTKQRLILRSRSCPEILEHCDRDGSPPPGSVSSPYDGSGGGSRRQGSHPTSRDKYERPTSTQQKTPPHQRRRRQRRSHQYQLSVDECVRPRGPGDGGGGGGGEGGGGRHHSGGRADYLHAAGDYSDNLPDRIISSAPGGVSRP